MCSNVDFLRRIMDEKDYADMDEDVRIKLAGIYQDAESLENAMDYGEGFALKYYLKIAGFKDERAASTFVDIVEKSRRLLASQELYDYTHDKLISGILKAKYTRLRKKLSI